MLACAIAASKAVVMVLHASVSTIEAKLQSDPQQMRAPACPWPQQLRFVVRANQTGTCSCKSRFKLKCLKIEAAEAGSNLPPITLWLEEALSLITASSKALIPATRFGSNCSRDNASAAPQRMRELHFEAFCVWNELASL